ncbi:MAG: hypothetical protein HKO89_06490, partial [Saprospiraceae bacterium]|nr:hypothetical protein [Saprospiraceae bacterium]
MDSKIIEKAELYATGIISNEFSDRLVYHDVSYQYRVIDALDSISLSENQDDEEKEILLIAGWFIFLGLKHLDEFIRISTINEFLNSRLDFSIKMAEDFLSENKYPENKKLKILDLMLETRPDRTQELSLQGKILLDAMTSELGESKGKRRIKKYYEELLLCHVVEVNQTDFFQYAISYLSSHNYYTDFALRHLRPLKESVLGKLIKERREIQKKEDAVLKSELGIDEVELKRLKRNLKSVQGRDDRGIQTMFRTTSRNHYTLSEMVDRKANIMISVNAIIMSIIIGNFIANDLSITIHNIPILVVLLTGPLSIFFAVNAIRPEKTHGAFTVEEIRSKQGNLLYFGNFHNMSLKDYEWGMYEMLNDQDFLYSSMVK